jgi:CHASE3 domain sensor protein
MKLEMKLALSTGTLVTAMFVSAFFAYGRIRDASALSDIISQKQLPVMLSARDARTSVLQSVNSLDSYILFGLNESTAAEYRRLRAAALQEAEASTAKLVEVRGRFNLGEDAARIDRLHRPRQSLGG